MEWLIVALLVAILALLAYIFLRPKPKEDGQGMVLLQNEIQNRMQAIESKLGEGTNRMFESMRGHSEQSQRLMSTITDQVSKQLLEVIKGVTETKESTKQV